MRKKAGNEFAEYFQYFLIVKKFKIVLSSSGVI